MYKIIYKGEVVDVLRNPSFVSFLPTGHIAMTDKSSAQGIVGSDGLTVYSFTSVNPDIKVVSIVSITNEEFNWLNGQLNSTKNVDDNIALSKARNSTIAALSEVCNTKIVEGFSLRLSDGEQYRFSMTTEDQLNLLSLENQLNSGEKTFIYHAAGHPCKVFTRNDMLKIVKAYRKHVLYHTTYFNVAKQCINSLTDLDKINNFHYGDDVMSIVNDKAIFKILVDGGVN